ncbi:MAG TPA: Uma2 family endonuclease [Isosphaeraceae bacterium]|jgi:Uma2 family endonuclease
MDATILQTPESQTPRTSAPEIPALENGDRLTRPEFERRYDAMPDVKKAELIEGVVHMPSPVAFAKHSGPHFDLITWLGLYRLATPGIRGGDNGSIRLDLDNMPQPDAFLLVLPDQGGQARVSADDYVLGGPELVAEVASSSVSYDLHAKLDVYRRNGVREYVVWRIKDCAIDWFIVRQGRYERLATTPEGHYRSEVFPGLWLDPAAMIRGDMASVARVSQLGLASPEHAAFVARLPPSPK